MSTPKPSLVKWVSSYQIGIHKSEDCEVPVILLDDLMAWLKDCRTWHHKYDDDCRHIFDDLLTQLEMHRKEG